MLVFQRKKYFGQFFLVSSTIKNLNEHIMGVYKVLWRSLCNLYDHFSGTLEVDQNKFSKIGYFPEKKTIWADFFPHYRVRQTTSNFATFG